jgi:lipopolysaccharide/colanic/teichoic acid biosynthesis glycosyltransferase
MRHDAHLAGPLVSTGEDVRVTRAGRIIRVFCFNELPQLINVLRGEMSLVGPRPEVPKFVAYWAPAVKDQILSVRPGITGLATVRIWHEAFLLEGKADVERAYLEEVLPQKQQLDLWYVRNRGFWLDLRIMFLTLLKALSGSRQLYRFIYRARQILSLEEKA